MAIIPNYNPRKHQSFSRPSKTPRGEAMKRILRSYIHKIKQVYPDAKIHADNAKDVLGCTTEEWADRLEAEFKEGLSWENYGTAWVVCNGSEKKEFDLTQSSDFYLYFNAQSYAVVRMEDAPRWVQRFLGVKPVSEPFVFPGLITNQDSEIKTSNLNS